jgi:hypothetical protein
MMDLQLPANFARVYYRAELNGLLAFERQISA